MALLGERLRQTREARGIAPLQVEMETRIRAAMIQALEQGDYDNLPPEPFLRGLIRLYATYLGLDSEEMLQLYSADRTPPPSQLTQPPLIMRPSLTKPAAPAPAPSVSDESTAPPAPLPPAEPVRKPAPIRLPSLRPPIPRPPARKPSLPAPPAPPESLTPAPLSATDSSATEPTTPRAHFTRRPMPLPAIAVFIGGIICVCLIIGLIAFWQLAPMLFQFAGVQTGTPTRLPPTRTPTLRPGANPTAIPTLAVTAPPFPSSPGTPTATLKATPRSVPETFNGLYLEVIEVTQPITLRVGVDGVLVFNGSMQPGTTRSWSAKDSLYVQIENPKGATLELNGNTKWFAPRIFAETKSLERQWTLNDQGIPILTTPVAPATPSMRAPTTPTPTLTPFL